MKVKYFIFTEFHLVFVTYDTFLKESKPYLISLSSSYRSVYYILYRCDSFNIKWLMIQKECNRYKFLCPGSHMIQN